MAEILVRAQASGNPAASEVGDIIVIRPDGHNWGKAECLPEYLIIKLPNISVDTVKHFEEHLMVQDGEETLPDNSKQPIYRMAKRRKWHIPATWISDKVALGNTVIAINVPVQKQALIDSVLEKTN